ncbi:MAG: hypothetical protein C4334_14045 [Pyrinomonas sp.]
MIANLFARSLRAHRFDDGRGDLALFRSVSNKRFSHFDSMRQGGGRALPIYTLVFATRPNG